MSLRPEPPAPIPAETARVARAAFPKGHPYFCWHDTFGSLFADSQFTALFAPVGQPALAPWRLALVTLLQFAEGLSDRQAADAVRSRLDWKYLLALPLTDPGFDASVLCEFRARLGAEQAAALFFEHLLASCRERELLPTRAKQRTDSTQVLAALRTLNRLEMVGETLRLTLEQLAEVAPAWLQRVALPAWGTRYARRFEQYRLPASLSQRETLAVQIGEDGWTLLQALYAETQTAGEWAVLWRLPAVQLLRQVWLQQYCAEDTPDPSDASGSPSSPGQVCLRWRTVSELPPAPLLICSPTEPTARFSQKGTCSWQGYKVHFTEVCEPHAPHLITEVLTTPAPVPDSVVLPVIQEHLAAQERLPSTHYVDAGYTAAEHSLRSEREYRVRLVGPPRADPSWQARAGTGFSAEAFQLDWEARQATCPAGHPSAGWKETQKKGRPVVQIHFAAATCQACEQHAQCTRAARQGRRLTLLPPEPYAARKAARQAAQSPDFPREYGVRAGIEGTHSQAVRRCGLRRCRYVGFAKVRLEHLLLATALNFLRLGDWLAGKPRAKTRPSKLACLLLTPAPAC